MNKYDEAVAALTPPEPFDARVFLADDTCSQDVCDFVLSLALAFDDFRDVILGQQVILDAVPEGAEPTKERGSAGGISAHLFRVLTALVHELLVLIDANRKVLHDPFFVRVVKKLHPEAARAWKTLTSTEKGAKSKDPLARLVYFARNKVAFHYDQKALASAYRSLFVEGGEIPYISTGASMAKTRFYFADAAAQHYIRTYGDEQVASDFFLGKLKIFMDLNHSVREIVAGFVGLRRAAGGLRGAG